MCVQSLGGVCRPLNIYLQQREVEQDDVRVTRHLSSSLNIFIMEISVRTLPFLYFLCVQVGSGFFSSLLPWFFMYVLSVHVLCLLQVVWGLDQVKLLNPPQQPVPDHFLKILFSCDKPASVQLDCLVTFDTGVTATHTLGRWRCRPGDPKIHILELKLPDWLVYQADGIVPASQEVLSCMLLTSIRHGGLEESVAAQDVASLQLQSHFDRPVKEHPLCFSWSTQMLRLTQRSWIKLCPVERGKRREVCAQCSLKPEIAQAELGKVSKINHSGIEYFDKSPNPVTQKRCICCLQYMLQLEKALESQRLWRPTPARIWSTPV